MRCSVDTPPPTIAATESFRAVDTVDGVAVGAVAQPALRLASRPTPLSGFPAVSKTFDAHNPQSVPRARRFIGQLCDRWLISGELRDDALRIASEFASNAHLHGAGPQFDVAALLTSTIHGPMLHLEITNGGTPPAPERTEPGPLSENGRGFHIVTTLSMACGLEYDVSDSRTRAWAYLPVPDEVARTGQGPPCERLE